jgi:hypothetical protein
MGVSFLLLIYIKLIFFCSMKRNRGHDTLSFSFNELKVRCLELFKKKKILCLPRARVTRYSIIYTIYMQNIFASEDVYRAMNYPYSYGTRGACALLVRKERSN